MKNNNEIFIEDELINSYLSYAMSVIIGRALPDVRDGLKPVHRRTLYVMKELNNKFNKSYKKSARIVGDVIGKYHPHGETAVYDSIVRLSQTFIQRYPLIDGQGNFGSIDGDSPAAMRYTEIRMAEISDYLLKDLDFNTVNYIYNYDNTEKYPIVFPSMIPNILLNGACGIAVGMATNIPPHNITEVLNACLVYLKNQNITTSHLKKYIFAPDFPTHGIIHNLDNIDTLYENGKGKINIKSKSILQLNKNSSNILITELPYQVNKLKLLIKIKHLIKNKYIEGIKFIRDETDKEGLRIFIALEKNKNIKLILNKLYSFTNLQTTFAVNMLCLVNNTPKLLDLKELIKFFILHRQEIVYRRTDYVIKKIKNKIHITEALYVVLFNTNKIVNLINKINTIFEFKNYIKILNFNELFFNYIKNFGFFKKMKNFNFSIMQIQSILDLKLSKLIKFEKNFIINSYFSLIKDYFYYKLILKNKNNIDKIIISELSFIKSKFSDKRRTLLFNTSEKLYNQSIMEKKQLIILLSENNYINTHYCSEYKTQHRGGKGRYISTYMKFKDTIISMTIEYNDNFLSSFSEKGKIYLIDLKKLRSSNKLSRGITISSIINIDKKDKINLLKDINLTTYNNSYIAIITKQGLLKILILKNIEKVKINGMKIINLRKDDKIIDAKIINANDELMIFSNVGRVIRFLAKKIKITGRQSKGVVSIKLKKNEYVVSLIVPENNCYILTGTENGYAKCTHINEYRLTNRGGRGIITHKLNEKTGDVIIGEKILNNKYLFTVTTNGIISKINVKEIPFLKRVSKGVLLIRLFNNEKLTGIKIDNEENI